MKRLFLTAILALAACTVPAAHAAESSVTVLLVGGPESDILGVKLSQDGRSYLIDSFSPLEAGGEVCASEEGSAYELTCEAAAVAGFEFNTGRGEDSVTISPKILVPATLRGGPHNDRLRGGGGADKIIGGTGTDHLYGHGGNDWLQGGTWDDWLYGGTGGDRLEGGPGADFLNGGPGKDSEDRGPKDRSSPV